MAITKRRISPAFDADDIIVDCYDWCGLSTDEKPVDDSIAINDLFLELDTGLLYYFDGAVWSPVGGEG